MEVIGNAQHSAAVAHYFAYLFAKTEVLDETPERVEEPGHVEEPDDVISSQDVLEAISSQGCSDDDTGP